MSTTKSVETGEFTVSDELYEISEATNSDGTVHVEIYDFEKVRSGAGTGDENRVKVHFRTPTLDKKTEVMDWPRRDSPEYKFVRICRQTVGGLNAANYLKTDGARIKADPDDWELVANRQKRDVVKGAVKGITKEKIAVALAICLGVAWFGTLSVIIFGWPVLVITAAAGVLPSYLSVGASAVWVAAVFIFVFTLPAVIEDP